MLKHANSLEFKKEVLENKRVVLVDFYATWCGPCKMLAPVLEKISNSRADFDIVKVNIDDSMQLATQYEIEVVPTMVVFKDGKPVDQLVGYAEEKDIIELVSEYID